MFEVRNVVFKNTHRIVAVCCRRATTVAAIASMHVNVVVPVGYVAGTRVRFLDRGRSGKRGDRNVGRIGKWGEFRISIQVFNAT